VAGFLLDTSALSAYLSPTHRYHGRAKQIIDAIPSTDAIFISVISLGEFSYGIKLAELAASGRLEEYRKQYAIIRQYALLPFTHHTSEAYAELKAAIASKVQRNLRSKLKRWIEDWVDIGSGKRLQIDENDVWICAQARERDLTVITGDSDVSRVAAYDDQLRFVLVAA
jgi:tRNA(fMet)-specific endonuclease VapC